VELGETRLGGKLMVTSRKPREQSFHNKRHRDKVAKLARNFFKFIEDYSRLVNERIEN
jgi:hypothetical protein